MAAPHTEPTTTQACAIGVTYEAEPRAGLYFVGPDAAYPDKPAQVWSQGEDEDNRHWFPCQDHPGARTKSSMKVTVPAGHSTLYGEYRSRSGIRLGVGLGGVAVAGVGAYFMLHSANNKEEQVCTGGQCTTEKSPDSSMFLVGSGIFIVGAMVAIFVPPNIKDEGRIRVVPGAPAAASGRAPSARGLASWDPIAGARVFGRF